MIFNNRFLLAVALLAASTCTFAGELGGAGKWTVSALPSSVRLNPVTNQIIDHQPATYPSQKDVSGELLDRNWIYDGDSVSLHAARGEYVSFQLVVTRNTDETLKHIAIQMDPFSNGREQFKVDPELFLEWSVDVKITSTGYKRATLGKGWYPDALIPFKYIQQDPSKVKGRWVYPLWLPDFNNRIPDQRSMIVWIDQYVPLSDSDAPAGTYSSTVSVTIGGKTERIPVHLTVWDFALPNREAFIGSLQQGSLSPMPEDQALQVYQLFKRNRVTLMDPTYHPKLSVSADGDVSLDWHTFDERLKKYFTGKAFTKSYGYDYGPGYGVPIKAFILPFDVYGKHGGKGWPDIGNPDEERKAANKAIYVETIKKVRQHMRTMVDPDKTELLVYLNGLDESYFPAAWERMKYYGNLFKKYYPETHFRIDGAYGKKAMKVVEDAISAWGVHTLNYNADQIREYRQAGIQDWVYGPLIYESRVNSWVGSITFTDLPLVNQRALSWACWKYGTYGWLSWGIGVHGKRAWYDPITWENAYKPGTAENERYHYKRLNGNAMLVYSPGIIPNVSGPVASIRLKAVRDGMEGYAYLRLLSQLDGNKKRADQLVNQLIDHPWGDKSIGHLNVWNYSAKKWDETRLKLGRMIDQAERE